MLQQQLLEQIWHSWWLVFCSTRKKFHSPSLTSVEICCKIQSHQKRQVNIPFERVGVACSLLSPCFSMLLRFGVTKPHMHCIEKSPRHMSIPNPGSIVRSASQLPCECNETSAKYSLCGPPLQKPPTHTLVQFGSHRTFTNLIFIPIVIFVFNINLIITHAILLLVVGQHIIIVFILTVVSIVMLFHSQIVVNVLLQFCMVLPFCSLPLLRTLGGSSCLFFRGVPSEPLP